MSGKKKSVGFWINFCLESHKDYFSKVWKHHIGNRCACGTTMCFACVAYNNNNNNSVRQVGQLKRVVSFLKTLPILSLKSFIWFLS